MSLGKAKFPPRLGKLASWMLTSVVAVFRSLLWDTETAELPSFLCDPNYGPIIRTPNMESLCAHHVPCTNQGPILQTAPKELLCRMLQLADKICTSFPSCYSRKIKLQKVQQQHATANQLAHRKAAMLKHLNSMDVVQVVHLLFQSVRMQPLHTVCKRF